MSSLNYVASFYEAKTDSQFEELISSAKEIDNAMHQRYPNQLIQSQVLVIKNIIEDCKTIEDCEEASDKLVKYASDRGLI